MGVKRNGGFVSMRRKGLTKESLQDFIMQAFFELLSRRNVGQLSVSDIVKQAGVSRSTYYRHFGKKEDIITRFAKNVLRECFFVYEEAASSTQGEKMSEQHLWLHAMFFTLERYREEITLLKKNNLTSLFLEVLNESFIVSDTITDIDRYRLRYHLGGLFNCFNQWIEGGIRKTPQEMTALIMEVLPKNYVPIMPHLSNSLYDKASDYGEHSEPG